MRPYIHPATGRLQWSAYDYPAIKVYVPKPDLLSFSELTREPTCRDYDEVVLKSYAVESDVGTVAWVYAENEGMALSTARRAWCAG